MRLLCLNGLTCCFLLSCRCFLLSPASAPSSDSRRLCTNTVSGPPGCSSAAQLCIAHLCSLLGQDRELGWKLCAQLSLKTCQHCGHRVLQRSSTQQRLCPTLLAGEHCVRQLLGLPLYKRWLTAELAARSLCPHHQTGWRAPSHHPLQGQDFAQHSQSGSLGRTGYVPQTGRRVQLCPSCKPRSPARQVLGLEVSQNQQLAYGVQAPLAVACPVPSPLTGQSAFPG